MGKFCSIIMVHYSDNEERSEMMSHCITSLIKNTKYPYELLVIDNGGSISDSRFLFDLSDGGFIHTYVKNKDNMHFGYARNQGLKLCTGDYICITDNDILYRGGWLEQCVKILEKFPEEKIYVTPFDYPTPVIRKRYEVGFLNYGEEKIKLNLRAGSNCFVIRRKDFEEIGPFLSHRIAGTKWTDQAVKKGYKAAILDGNYAEDMGLRKGYDLNDVKPIALKVANSDPVHFNQDEFHKRTGIVCEDVRTFK